MILLLLIQCIYVLTICSAQLRALFIAPDAKLNEYSEEGLAIPDQNPPAVAYKKQVGYKIDLHTSKPLSRTAELRQEIRAVTVPNPKITEYVQRTSTNPRYMMLPGDRDPTQNNSRPQNNNNPQMTMPVTDNSFQNIQEMNTQSGINTFMTKQSNMLTYQNNMRPNHNSKQNFVTRGNSTQDRSYPKYNSLSNSLYQSNTTTPNDRNTNHSQNDNNEPRLPTNFKKYPEKFKRQQQKSQGPPTVTNQGSRTKGTFPSNAQPNIQRNQSSYSADPSSKYKPSNVIEDNLNFGQNQGPDEKKNFNMRLREMSPTKRKKRKRMLNVGMQMQSKALFPLQSNARGPVDRKRPNVGMQNNPNSQVRPNGDMQNQQNSQERPNGDIQKRPNSQERPNGGMQNNPNSQVRPNGGMQNNPNSQVRPNGGIQNNPNSQVRPNGGMPNHPNFQVRPIGGMQNNPNSQERPNDGMQNRPNSQVRPNGGMENNPNSPVRPDSDMQTQPNSQEKPNDSLQNHPNSQVRPNGGMQNNPNSQVRPNGDIQNNRNYQVRPNSGMQNNPNSQERLNGGMQNNPNSQVRNLNGGMENNPNYQVRPNNGMRNYPNSQERPGGIQNNPNSQLRQYGGMQNRPNSQVRPNGGMQNNPNSQVRPNGGMQKNPHFRIRPNGGMQNNLNSQGMQARALFPLQSNGREFEDRPQPQDNEPIPGLSPLRSKPHIRNQQLPMKLQEEQPNMQEAQPNIQEAQLNMQEAAQSKIQEAAQSKIQATPNQSQQLPRNNIVGDSRLLDTFLINICEALTIRNPKRKRIHKYLKYLSKSIKGHGIDPTMREDFRRIADRLKNISKRKKNKMDHEITLFKNNLTDLKPPMKEFFDEVNSVFTLFEEEKLSDYTYALVRYMHGKKKHIKGQTLYIFHQVIFNTLSKQSQQIKNRISDKYTIAKRFYLGQ